VSSVSQVDGTGAPTVAMLREARRRGRFILSVTLLAAIAVASIAALLIGPAQIGLWEVFSAFNPFAADASQGTRIVQAIRIPRLLLAIIAGAALGICGAALQGLFRNPLADPSIIGVSGGAALAVGLVLVGSHMLPETLMQSLGIYLLPLAAFGGGMMAILGVYALASRASTGSGVALILAGIAVNALCGSGLGYLTFVSSDNQLRELIFWTLGSLGRVTWTSLLPAAALMIAATALLLLCARELNAYLLGEREAAHLGVDVEALKRRVIAASALGIGAAVAVTGMIGFVGLAAPHMVRLFAGADHRIVLPGSALVGALLLIVGDMIARVAVAPAELPIGILTGALGGPFFLWLLGRYRKELF
jgi:iron complex transport system permease protein